MSNSAKIVGGVANTSVDVPICSVFLALFVVAGGSNTFIFFRNRARNHPFIMSHFMFVFCLVRIITCSMRIAWATHPTSKSIAIAAQVFTNAGTLILWLINLTFARRILAAAHPSAARSRTATVVFWTLIGLLPISLIMLIVAVVISFYTTNPNTLEIVRGIQYYGLSLFLLVSALPLFIVPAAVLTPPRKQAVEPFGSGTWWTQISVLMLATALATTTAGFRAGTTYSSGSGHVVHPWYTAKWAFYFFNFTVEYCTILVYLIFRVDKRFYIDTRKSGQTDTAGDEMVQKGFRVSEDTK